MSPTQQLAASPVSPLVGFFAHPGEHYPIYTELASLLDLKDILRLMATCSELRKTLGVTFWGIDKSLQRYFHDPYGFRYILARYDAIISGSFVLQFFERVRWSNPDLDIFVQSSNFAELEQHLRDREGYGLVQKSIFDPSSYISQYANEMWTYQRLIETPNSVQSERRTVQVITTVDVPIEAILMGFYTTAALNFITSSAAFSIFPRSTFIHHKTYLLKPLNSYYGPLLQRYSACGWATQDILWEEDRSPSHEIRKHRYTGDRHTWVIPFKNSPAFHPDRNMSMNHFSISKFINGLSAYYKITANVFGACVLFDRYTYPGSGVAMEFWVNVVAKRLDRLTFIELFKLQPEARPAGLASADVVRHLRGLYRFEDEVAWPEEMTYFDAELVKWWGAWEREHWEDIEGEAGSVQ